MIMLLIGVPGSIGASGQSKEVSEESGESNVLDLRPRVGFGISAGTSPFGGELMGGHLLYTVERHIHLGAQVSFVLSKNGNNPGRISPRSSLTWSIAPYAKVFLPVRGNISPFLIGSLTVRKEGLVYEVPDEDFGVDYEYGPTASISTAITIGGGAEYFIEESFGIFGTIGLIEAELGTGDTRIGLLSPRVGIEWIL